MPARKAAEKAAAQPEAKPAIEPNKQETEPESESQERVSEISPAEEPSKPRRTATADVYGDNTEASRRVRPEKYTKGLRYGKGAKVVTGRESATARRSKNGDVIIKIAILVALLAIAVLLYGLYNDWRAGKLFLDDVPVIDNSEIYEEVPQSAEEGIRNPDLDYLTPKN
jgi:cobalamin biosynthesis Mg chelatase CobN